MSSLWSLLSDAVPDRIVEVSPGPWLKRVVERIPSGPILLVNPSDVVRASFESAPREVETAVWPSSADPSRPGGDIGLRRGRLAVKSNRYAAVVVGDAFETCDDPAALAREIARVVMPAGKVAGVTLSAVPAVTPALRLLPPLGLRIVLESAGLHVRSLVPGPDSQTFREAREFGRTDWPGGEGLSPGNARMRDWGRESRRGASSVMFRMLEFAGGYGWTATPAEQECRDWLASLASASAGSAASDEGVARPRRMRRYALAMPTEPPREIEVEADARAFISNQIASTGLRGYEPHSLAAMLASADLAGEGAVLDVGANMGVFALVAAACTDRDVAAFEPMPDLASTARDAAARNGLARLRVEEIALAAENGSARFYASAVSDASNSLNPSHRVHSAEFDVVLETLDSWVSRTGLRPAVLKIDTETTEPDVVRGGLATIGACRPWILCEVLTSGRPDEIAELFAPLGYHAHHISPEHRWPERPRPVPVEEGMHYNWLLAPQELDDTFWSRLDDWRARIDACGARDLA